MHEDTAQLPEVGDVLKGLYRLEGQVGRGAFGVVYRATHLDLDEAVAVKLVRPSLLGDRKLLRRFRREVQIAKGLKHPNTVRILDTSETDDGIPYYVMEFLDGVSLMELIDEEMGLGFARTRRVLVQVLKALSEAHAKDVVHRDLKPENIVICDVHGEPDFVKLVDFGIASLRSSKERLTLGNAVVGTPSYMSPEQALGMDVDARSDVYSVGLIGIECLTGEPVVTAASLVEMLSRQASYIELPLPKPLLRSPIGRVLARAIRKEPVDRFDSAAAMIQALQDLNRLTDEKLPLELDGDAGDGDSSVFDETADHEPLDSIDVTSTIDLDESADELSPTVDRVDGLTISAEFDVPSGGPAYVTEEWDPATPSRLGPPRWLVPAALLGFAIAVVALVVATSAGTDQPSETPSSAAPGEPAADPGSSHEPAAAESAAERVAANVTEGAHAIADRRDDEPGERETLLAAFEIVHERVDAAIPVTHVVTFGGLEGVRVTSNGELLGVTPFEAHFPRVPSTIDVTYERRGYHASSGQVALSDERVEVALRRVIRDPHADRSEEEGAPETDAPPEGLFGSAPIDRPQ